MWLICAVHVVGYKIGCSKQVGTSTATTAAGAAAGGGTATTAAGAAAGGGTRGFGLVNKSCWLKSQGSWLVLNICFFLFLNRVVEEGGGGGGG